MFPVLCWLEHLGGEVKILDKDLILVKLHSFPHLQNFLLQAMSLNCYLHFFVCPRYALDDIGSGSHVHLSLCQS
ncbi:unnamed protein product [Camellia sinensis]